VSRKHATHPHPGRSYTASSGAFVRVDYVKRTGTVQCVIWPTWWTSKSKGRLTMLTAEQWAAFAKDHDFQPVGCAP